MIRLIHGEADAPTTPASSVIAHDTLFHEHYDDLFAAKDYAGEVAHVMVIAATHGIRPDRILEVGCGTGNHTRYLAASGASVTGIDPDPSMVRRAAAKVELANLPQVTLRCEWLEHSVERGFSLGVALFNVINYLPTLPSLERFFHSLHRCIRPGGLIIFDCWNGVAAIRTPPKSKHSTVTANGATITCALTSETDLMRQRAHMAYGLSVAVPGQPVQSETFAIEHALWTPMEIEGAVAAAGFKVLECLPAFAPGRPATADDWKLMFVCQREME